MVVIFLFGCWGRVNRVFEIVMKDRYCFKVNIFLCFFFNEIL